MKNLLSSCQLDNISGDKKLNFVKKIYWILICLINYFLSFVIKKDSRIKIEKFNGNNQKFVNIERSQSLGSKNSKHIS